MAAMGQALREEGLETVLTREPGGTPAGDAVREIFLHSAATLTPMTELLLINASRAEFVAGVIRPALERHAAVLCDRYTHSSLAYQGYGRGLPLELVRMTCAAATGGLAPDLTIYVDISYERSRERLAERGHGNDRMERQDADFFRRAREGFRELARRDPRIVQIDGEAPADEVMAQAMAALIAVRI